jgi:hypothetical protein
MLGGFASDFIAKIFLDGPILYFPRLAPLSLLMDVSGTTTIVHCARHRQPERVFGLLKSRATPNAIVKQSLNST